MHPHPIGSILEDTIRVTKVAFPKGDAYMQMSVCP
jgi:hypothetical protein